VLLFLPIRAQIRLHKWPVMTILVSLLCLGIYVAQAQNEGRILRAAENYCDHGLDASEQALWRQIGKDDAAMACTHLLAFLHVTNRPEQVIQGLETSLTRELKDRAEAERLAGELRASYARFARQAPGYLTARLWQERPSWNVWRWITSSFAHADWGHVIFNLVFFFAFAATVELLIWPVLFLGMILLMSLGIGLTDTLVHLGQAPVPTLGLSGVVTGMLAMFIYFVPRAKIRFFFWFLLSIGFIGVPGWLVGLWYIGGDLLRVLGQEHSRVNYIAHLAGALSGFLLGVTLFRGKRHWAQELVEDKLDLTRDESGLSKLNAFTSAPGVLMLIAIAFIVAATLFARFLTLFWLQLLLAAPVFAAFWQFHRWRRAQRPEHERLRAAAAQQARGEYAKGHGEIEALAARGNARAMLALGEIYERGQSVVRDLAQATHWYEQAAKRNNPEALYRLGLMSLEGRGVRKDLDRIRDGWQRAANGGHAQAAMSLAHLCENTAGTREVRMQAREEAARWYHQAGRLFLKQGRRDDARMAATALRGLEADHPLAQQLEAEIGPPSTPPRQGGG
jgi:membrane associated rhomboid family serine protease